MKITFEKYHGAGNDFIIIDSRKNGITKLASSTISSLCDRHFGIGADGLIILRESEQFDFRMDYYNADGHPGSMCGNGGRCSAAVAHEHGWITEKCVFEASDGTHRAELLPDNRVRLELRDVLKVQQWQDGYFLDTGSPHLVLFRDDIDDMDVYTEGRVYRYHKELPAGANVNFVKIREGSIKVRTYERGVEAETMSCGTGVTASAIASALHFEKINPPVEIVTRGGELEVMFSFDENGSGIFGIFLTGEATKVFEGEVGV